MRMLQKIISFILKASAEQLGVAYDGVAPINVRLRHQDIASMSGLARETVSLEMKKMEKLGIIRYKRGIIQIKNLKTFSKKPVWIFKQF